MSKAGLIKFLAGYPDDATRWGQATDEIRDIARTAKEYYNEFEEKKIQPCNFLLLTTPAKWNAKGKRYILKVYDKMSKKAKTEFNDYLKRYFEIK